jgi:hypothetical protein
VRQPELERQPAGDQHHRGRQVKAARAGGTQECRDRLSDGAHQPERAERNEQPDRRRQRSSHPLAQQQGTQQHVRRCGNRASASDAAMSRSSPLLGPGDIAARDRLNPRRP